MRRQGADAAGTGAALCIRMLDALPIAIALLMNADTPPNAGEERWDVSVVRLIVEHGQGAPNGLEEAAAQAASTWNEVGVGPRIEVARDDEPVDDPLNVDEHSRVGVMREPWPYPAQAGAATITWAFTETSHIFEADVALNPDIEFGDGESERHDLVSVLTHELGHVLGLQHVEDDAEATMFPTIPRGEVKKRDLSLSDVSALLERYAGTELAAEDPDAVLEAAAEDQPATGCAQAGPPAAEAALALALVAIARGRRARRRNER